MADIFQKTCSNAIFFNENVWISIMISLTFVPKGPFNNIPALVQIMAWRRPGNKPLSEPMMVRLPMHIYASLSLNELTHEWTFWRKYQSVDTESVSTHGGVKPPAFIFMLNALSFKLQGTDLCYYHMFWNTGSGGTDSFVCKVNIRNINGVQATASILNSRTDVLEKVLMFLRYRCSPPRRDLIAIQGFGILALAVKDIFVYKVNMRLWKEWFPWCNKSTHPDLN